MHADGVIFARIEWSEGVNFWESFLALINLEVIGGAVRAQELELGPVVLSPSSTMDQTMRPISSYSTPPNCAFIPGLIGVVFPESAIPPRLFGECEVERHRFAAGHR